MDVSELLGHAVTDLERRVEEISVDLDVPDSFEAQCIDQVGLTFRELLENAITHATEPPDLTVTGRIHNGAVEIRFADTAPPIPEMEYRVLTGDREMTDVYHGGGLGMRLVFWAVDLSDGNITFREPDDGGNEITVSLPRSDIA